MPLLTRRRYRARRVLVLGAVAVAVIAGPARAQSPVRGLEFEDLGFTHPPDVSARAAGLAGLVTDETDATALVYNPAGLCRIKQRAPMLGMSGGSYETVTSYSGTATSRSSDWRGAQFGGGAYSIPVFQGSLVPAIAVYRAFVSDLDLAYATARPELGRSDEYHLDQSGSTFAFVTGVGVDLASVLSAGFSVSLLEGGYHTLRQTHTRTDGPAPAVDTYVIDDISGDLNGVCGRVGVVLYAHPHVRLAMNFTTPTVINGSTRQTRETTIVTENSTGSSTRKDSETSTEYIIPYRIDGGLAIPWGPWLLAVQAGACNWSQAAIDGTRLRLQDGTTTLGRTVEYRAGIEWTASRWPLRLRAGVARLPFAPDYLLDDRIDGDQLVRIASESQPLRIAVGAGIALKHTILIDAAFTHTRGDRSTSGFTEKRTWSQVLLEGSYWF